MAVVTSLAAGLRRRAKAGLKELLYVVLRLSGAPQLVRVLMGRRHVAILVYHRPDPAVLDRHLAYIRRVGNLISLDALTDALARRDLSSVPRGSVVITIDDGHRSNRTLRDVLVRHGCTPTIFVCTQIVGTRRRYWWSALNLREGRRLMRVPNVERLAELRVRHGYDHLAEAAEPQALTAEEIEELAGLVDFEPHTRLHPILPRCDLDEAQREVFGSKRDLETLLGRGCRHFAYPNGDYGRRELELVRAAGFASARTIEPGWNGAGTDPYRLKVLGIDDTASVNALAVHLGGFQILRHALDRLPGRARHGETRRSGVEGLDLRHGQETAGRPTVVQ